MVVFFLSLVMFSFRLMEVLVLYLRFICYGVFCFGCNVVVFWIWEMLGVMVMLGVWGGVWV